MARRRIRFQAAGLVLVAALLVAAVPASAEHNNFDPPWPQALPGAAAPYVRPHAVTHCPRGTHRCIDSLIRRLRSLWRSEDATCDHRAVGTLAYLRINEELRRELRKPKSIFRYKQWFYYVLTTFSNRYFASIRDHEARKPVAESWQIAYEAMASADITAAQDVLLFSNAHVQHDLPFAYEQMGVVTAKGQSRKTDHDAFNEINNRIQDPVGDEIARRYDPTFSFIDMQPSPLDEVFSLQVVKGWREMAWRNGERLANAKSAAERAGVVADIDSLSANWARLIASFVYPGVRAQRDGYCLARPG